MRFQLGERVRLRGRDDVGAGQVVGMRRNGGILLQWSTGYWPVRRWCDPEELEVVGNEPLHPGEK
jgi:hypothetical protein